jgi:hypothetical protein
MPSLLVNHIFDDALKATLKNFAGFYRAFPVGGRLVVCVSVTEDREIPMPSEKPLAKRRRLAAQRVLTERDLGPPLLVRRGRPVELIYARGAVHVTALGVAQEDGALGDPVRVINAESRRQLQGIVSGPDEVAFGSVAAASRSEGRAR